MREVDLSLPEVELPDFTGKTRNEILDILANNVGEDHEKLIAALKHNNIQHTVTGFRKNIFVKNCDWTILLKISDLVDDLQCDLTVSGGGPCEYLGSWSARPTIPKGNELSNTKDYQRRIFESGRLIHNNEHGVKIGVIDSGCSFSLYQDRENIMHDKMIDTSNAEIPLKVDYSDCFKKFLNHNILYKGHGTGVVEIIASCVSPCSKIYVANIGITFNVSNVACAMKELFALGADVLNCSFTIKLNSRYVRSKIISS